MKKVKLKINLFICLCIIITSIFYKSDIINASTTNFETLLEQQEYVTNPENIKNDLGNDVYQEMLAQIPALEAYTQLYNSFRNENGDIVYPEGYAGEYIEGDTLFVCTNSIDTSFIDGFSNIKIKKVNYSIKELIAFANEIKIDNPNHEMEGYTISPKDNSLYVYIKKIRYCFC